MLQHPRRSTISIVGLAVAAAFFASTGLASAHTEGDADFGHVVAEVVRWGVALGAIGLGLFAIFWLRARWLEGRES